MSKLNLKAIFLTILILVFSRFGLAEDILGCGGFIKSHTNIDYTKVHIKLYTKSGSLKDQTECAPNNGYYFLPLYDKGEYVLKVDPPKGWSFEPTEVSLNVDGVTDICSQGKDINFTFKGFGITGKVSSKFDNSGAKGIKVSLYLESDKNNPLKVTTTDQDGTFYFTPIRPGKYIVIATHPVWTFEKDTVSVTVSEGNTELPENSLVIFGYDVNGRVMSKKDPVSGVSFLLFGDGEVKKCLTTPVKGYKKEKPLCHVLSDKNGRFTFPAVTVGKYKVVPFYANEQTKFDVQPSELSFQVGHNSLILPQDFKITGFSIYGMVKNTQSGEPVEGAKVLLAGEQVAVTDKDGKYKIDNIKSGQYTLTAQTDNISFEDKLVDIFPSKPQLPTIFSSGYKVTGKVTLSAKGTLHDRNINIKSENENKIIKTNPKTGEFSVFLAPGNYIFSVAVDETEKSKGLQFYPMKYKVDVVSHPIDAINFLQLKATLKGTVQCLKNTDCSQAKVTLKILHGLTVQTVQTKDGKYEFKEVLPAQYEVLIDTDVFCWANPSHEIVVISEVAEVPPFVQTGFSMTFISSHETSLEYTHASKKVVLEITKGSNRHCMPEQGSYEFFPKGCHVYPKSSYVWETSNQTPLMLSSTEHRHRGSIISANLVKNVKVKIEIEGTADPLILGPLPYTKTADNRYKYEFEFNAVAESSYIISPISDILLFNPEFIKVIGVNDCHDNIATFSAELGKIISGSISPPLEGVTVNIFTKDKEEPIHTLVTTEDGSYKVGPLNGMLEYSIVAEKEGFIVTGPDAQGIFSAYKLAEIIVEVHDQASNVSLQGALLSLTGGDSYRKNSVTGDNGQMVFNSLSPGKYYLRPMMKEYRFEPPSKMINVEEGSTIRVTLLGKRFAFSAYGSVTSLNREPEPGLVVEAQGQLNCSDLQEETTTDESGNFKIRGLQPNCNYAIRLKPRAEANARVQRTRPSSIVVQVTEDVHNVRLVVFHWMTRVDLVVHVVSNPPEHYRTLRVKLCREDNPDSPIHTAKLDATFVPKSGAFNPGQLIHFPSLQLNNKYFLQLESSLSRANHKYKTTPMYFEANSSFKYMRMEFETERKQDHGDVGQTSVVALPFIILVAFAFLYRDKLWGHLNVLVEKWSKPAPPSRSTPVHAVPIDPRADDIIVEQIMNINKRKTKLRKI